MYGLLLDDGRMIGQIFPKLELVQFREDINPALMFSSTTEVKSFIKILNDHPDLHNKKIDIVTEGHLPSKFTHIRYRRGSKTSRPVGWVVNTKACSICGVLIHGVRYLEVDSIRFCPFCVKRYVETVDQILENITDEVKEEYYNVFLLENL